MTRIAIIKNQSGEIVDSRGMNIGPLVDTNPVIKIRIDGNNDILGVDSHITVVADQHTSSGGTNDMIDGGTF